PVAASRAESASRRLNATSSVVASSSAAMARPMKGGSMRAPSPRPPRVRKSRRCKAILRCCWRPILARPRRPAHRSNGMGAPLDLSRPPGEDGCSTRSTAGMSGKTIQEFDGAAGGWPSLRSVAAHLRKADVAVTGAKTLLSMNQPDGFDCPGCAWPDRDHTSTFEFCENGAKAVAAEATKHRAGPELFARHSVTQLAQYSDHWLEQQGRLTTPMRYDAGSDHYVAATWDEAFALIARHLNALPSPDEAIFYTSGRTSNEAAFLYQLFVREYGTNNFPDCSNMCHESSGTALKPQVGVGKGTVSLQDFEQADCILVFGQNPGTNHPRMLGELRDAAKRGCRIAAFNPLRERGLE